MCFQISVNCRIVSTEPCDRGGTSSIFQMSMGRFKAVIQGVEVKGGTLLDATGP